MGRSYFRQGAFEKGAAQYRAGIEMAVRANDVIEESRLRVRLLQDEIRWLGPQRAAAELALVRRKMHRAGDPSISLTFHLCLAELAAKLGLMQRAHRHLETAQALLPTVDKLSAEVDVKLTAVPIALLESNFGEALRNARGLIPLVEQTGNTWAQSKVFGNLGHIQLAQASFLEAEDSIHRALRARNSIGAGELPLLNTLMMLDLAQGNIDRAGKRAEAIEQVIDRTSARDSYNGLWSLVPRIKWLYRSTRSGEGLATALEAIPRIERVADRDLLDRMKLLAAEGLGRTDQAQRGTAFVAAVVKNEPEGSLDLMAEAFRVAGRLAVIQDQPAGLSYFQRARRIFTAIGNLAADAEVIGDIDELVVAVDKVSHKPCDWQNRIGTEDTRERAARLTEHIAALLEMGAHAPLLAAEALSLVADTGCVSHATIVATGKKGAERLETYADDASQSIPDDSNAVRILIGRHRDRQWEVVAIPKRGSAARVTLLAVERVIYTALALAEARHLRREQAALWPEQTIEQQLGLVCSSDRMIELIKIIRQVAGSNVTVLLTGETGVGKELFARALHQASARSDRVFLPYNCSTVPRDMLDSQLFGHKRGAFTGAQNDSAGIIRSAAGGTLFLDEIGEMALETQPKLLRFLESGEVLPLGEAKPQLVDVRIVAATNANLDQAVADGRFREDLYYRLNVIRINIPPLRERREEIPALVEYFLEKFGRELHRPMLRVADETLEYLVLYRWPGNVRQLGNELRRMVAMAEPGAVLMPAHLSDDIAASRRTVPVNTAPRLFNEVVTRIDQPLSAAVEHIERATIQRALSMTDGRLDEAAKMLGVSRKGLYLKRQRLNLG
jgi:DNA-binding NtrC family response regulator